MLIQEVNEKIKEFDVIISPSFGGTQLSLTNLTGHPCVVVPNGFNKNGSPTSLSFIGNLFDEASILEFVKKFQENSDFEEKHPKMFLK